MGEEVVGKVKPEPARKAKTWAENFWLGLQILFLLPFFPLLLLFLLVLWWSDEQFTSPPGTSKLRSLLFWFLFLLLCVFGWMKIAAWATR